LDAYNKNLANYEAVSNISDFAMFSLSYD